MDDAARPLPLHPGLLTPRCRPLLAGLLLALAFGSPGTVALADTPRPPWSVGDAPVPPWRVVAVKEHPEFVRYSLEDGTRNSEVEIACSDGTAGPLATKLYRVQPAPGARPEPELLRRLRDELERLEATPGHRPFVTRLERGNEEPTGSPRTHSSGSSPTRGRIVFPPGFHARILQAGWLLLLVLLIPLVFRAGRAVHAGGAASVAAALLSAAAALLLQPAQPARALHPNGHSWREAREYLSPFGVRDLGGLNPYLHGRGGLALQWLALPRPAGIAPTSPGPLPDPFDAARAPLVLAAATTALLAVVLTGRAWAGLLAGLLSAVHPLSLFLGSSGSPLSAAAFALPLSLALLIAAKGSGDRLLLGGASLAGALATSSHSAAVFWPLALAAAWRLLPPSTEGSAFRRPLLFAATGLVAAEWAVQIASVLDIAASSLGSGGAAPGAHAREILRFLPHDLLFGKGRWSPLVLPVLCVLSLCGPRRDAGRRLSLAAAAALVLGSVPFLAPHACLSDLVRYQAPLVGLVCALGTAGLARSSALLGPSVGPALLLLWLLTVPPASSLPVEPDVAEHAFLAQVLPSLRPGTVVELPPRELGSDVLAEFPDYLVPPGVTVVRAGSPPAAPHAGPRLVYAGLACLSQPWSEVRGASGKPANPGMRPVCGQLVEGGRPFRTTTVSPVEIPLRGNGSAWTFLSVTPGAHFGLWVPGLRVR